MNLAKGAQLARFAVHLALALAIFMLPTSSRAAVAGVWQTPLTFWLVDGYGFGEYVGTDWYHLGEDAHGDPGTEVHASANGTVRLAKDMNGGGWGGIILAEHTDQAGTQVVSLYGHLDASSFQVTEGQEISRGQLIGYLGDSSVNGGWPPHLHFAIRDGRYVDAWAGEPWVYAGYGDEEEMANWFMPTDYIEAHKHIVEVQRVPEDSPNRFTTAVGVSQRRFETKGSAKALYIASGASFADALASAPLTNLSKAPLLLSTKDSLPKETAAEIKRVLAKDSTVYLLGGLGSVAYSVEQAINSLGYHTERIAGTNREGTAASIAAKFPNAKSVFIVNRDAFPDAVSAGGAANLLGMPLLFTDGATLSETTKKYLKKHTGITKAYVIGGKSVIESNVIYQLRAIPTLATVKRISGENRYETNISVVSAFTNKPETLVFATGANFPDALTGSGLVSSEKGSLLLTPPDKIPSQTQAFIDKAMPALDAALVLGGTSAIDPSIDTHLASTLNAPVTTASVSAASQETTQAEPTLNPSAPTKLTGLSVPSISGTNAIEKIFNGAIVASLVPHQESHELAPPVSITRIPLNGRTGEQTLAAWFGVPEWYVSSHQTMTAPDEPIVLRGMPTVLPAEMLYGIVGDDLVLAAVSLPVGVATQMLDALKSQL